MSLTTFDETFQAATDNKIIPGAVLVATNKAGTLNYAKVFGKTGVSPEAKSLEIDSTFWTASCTKIVTTIAVLQCVERGLFSLDSPDDVARLLPEIAAPDILSFDAESKPTLTPATKKITARQLLTHTAGFCYELLDPRLQAWRKTPSGQRKHGDKFLDKYLTPLMFEPGESWMYSVSMGWAGKMVERASNLALEDYFQQHIWDPLSIQDLTFYIARNERVKHNLVEMTHRVAESGVLIHGENEYESPSEIDPVGSGGEGLWGSAPEYLKILRSILRDDGKLLTSDTIAEMFKLQLSPAPRASWLKILDEMPLAQPAFTGNAAVATEFTWGLGGMLSLEDMPDGRRKKGSLAWGGLPNLFWWIDPDVGVAGLYASQVVPTGDQISTEMFAEFEKDVYKQARALK